MVSWEEFEKVQEAILIRNTANECRNNLHCLYGILSGKGSRVKKQAINAFLKIIREIEADAINELKELVGEVEK